MTKLVENFGKILMVFTIAILFYTFFVKVNVMIKLYAIGAMMLGVLIINWAQNDFKVKLEKKDIWTYLFIASSILFTVVAYLS